MTMYYVDLQSYDGREQTVESSLHVEHTLEDAIVSAALHAVGGADGLAPYVVSAQMSTEGHPYVRTHAVDVTDRVIAAANEVYAAYVAATN
jgi:hypothetical protein